MIDNRKGFWRAKLPHFHTKPSNFCNIQIVIKSQPYMALVWKLVSWLFRTCSLQLWNSFSCSSKFRNYRSRDQLLQKAYYTTKRNSSFLLSWISLEPLTSFDRLNTKLYCFRTGSFVTIVCMSFLQPIRWDIPKSFVATLLFFLTVIHWHYIGSVFEQLSTSTQDDIS